MPNPYFNPAEQESIEIKGYTGLRNNVNKERLGPNDLLDAENIDLDDAGQVSRRRGYVRKIIGDFHSAYTDGDGTLWCVKDGTLCIVNPDYTTISIYAGFGSRKVSYVEIGRMLYLSSAKLSIKVNKDTRTTAPWGAEVSEGVWVSPVTRPRSTLGDIAGKLLGAPPTADYLAYYNGRIWLAHENLIWCTELWQYDYVNKTKNFVQFESSIGGMVAVSEGLVVGSQNGVYFMSGELGKMGRKQLDNSPVIPGSMVHVSANDLDEKLIQPNNRDGVMLTTQAGLCLALDDTSYRNLSGNKFWFPEAQSAAAMLRAQNGITQYVNVANSGGSPVSSARVGDYVDAEIVRFNQGA